MTGKILIFVFGPACREIMTVSMKPLRLITICAAALVCCALAAEDGQPRKTVTQLIQEDTSLVDVTESVKEGAVLPDHPRLLLPKGGEKALKKLIKKDPMWTEIHNAIIEEAERMLELPQYERTMVGRRMQVPQFSRIFYLSYSYRMTGDKRFLRKAEEEMVCASSYSDWNPSHFLDAATMTAALAIGYDWLYPQLSESVKRAVEDAIIDKGLYPSFDPIDAWFVDAETNWNQVCHSGITLGALAIWETAPDLSRLVTNRAVDYVTLPLAHYAPDGAYPEGYHYWSYGTSFNALLISALESVFGTDFGLCSMPGFLRSSEFIAHMTTPSLHNFNFSDNNSGVTLFPEMFWFYSKTGNPTILYDQARLYRRDGVKPLVGTRFLPAMVIWGASESLAEAEKPESLFWVSGGDNPLALMRSSWDSTAVHVGFKGGCASINHGHMDAGSFVMESQGVRWAIDPGSVRYNDLETKGVRLWTRTQNSQRWDVYKYNNFAHNTLTFNHKYQSVKDTAKIVDYSDDPDAMSALCDLSPVYSDWVKTAKRQVSLLDKETVTIEDWITTGQYFTKLTWNLTTPAEVSRLSDRELLLQKDGKSLYMTVEGLDNLTWDIGPAEPLFSFDEAMPGITMVRFHSDLKLSATQKVKVTLSPKRLVKTEDNLVAEAFALADKQLRVALEDAEAVRAAKGKTLEELPSPRNLQPDGSLNLVRASDWCSGFFPGNLWLMYEYSQDPFWKEKAKEYTAVLEGQKLNKGTHDLGFMMGCSFGQGLRLEPSQEYEDILLETAKSLASRYNPAIGLIRSWDFNADVWKFPVIIDNMMNLELLFWAAKASGDANYYKIAVSHADKTMANHFREDGSSWHVVDYDPATGQPRLKQTHQGFADDSAWARGQAWGLYGFTMCYRETGDERYLKQAEKIASFIFNNPNLPEDKIPYWDYNDPGIKPAPAITEEDIVPRDASAAAVTVSALYELSQYSAKGDEYRRLADEILLNLKESYSLSGGEGHGFLLRSSTGSKPQDTEVDVPLVYADYYYLEALLRRNRLSR